MLKNKPSRELFAEVGQFCQKYGYSGAYWNGKSLICYSWHKKEHVIEDTLDSFIVNELEASLQQSEWFRVESKLDNYLPFSWGSALNAILPQTSQIPD